MTETSRRPRSGPKPATPERLDKAALAYLERYASSAEHLRRVLMRRVDRSARAHGTDRAAGAAHVDALIERYRQAGLLDDARFAEGRIVSLRRQGASARKIKAALKVKGVADAVIDGALGDHAARAGRAGDADDLAAALGLARRRRLGPYRMANRVENRQRDLAALGRSGFSYETARRVIEAVDVAELEAEIGG
ncbi:MAG: RecX family transcriptional regulator [Alphaproteobacteria bacterium]|nr:RecX family transcriptional regulator [Alphaproteobacteria bacterium]